MTYYTVSLARLVSVYLAPVIVIDLRLVKSAVQELSLQISVHM